MHLFQLEQENFWIQFCIPHWKSQWNQLRVFCFVGKDSYIYTWAKMQNWVFFSERKSLHSICIKLKLCLLLWMLLFNDPFDTFSLQSIWDWRLFQNTYGVGRFPSHPTSFLSSECKDLPVLLYERGTFSPISLFQKYEIFGF